jgi:twitching motility protein PilT
MEQPASPVSTLPVPPVDAAVPQPGPPFLRLLRIMVERKASDLHLSSGMPPLIRLAGRLVPAGDFPKLSAAETREMALSLLNDDQRERFEQDQDIDFSFLSPGLARFRCCVYTQRGTLSIALRVVPVAIPPLDSLGLPPILPRLAQRPQGLVLVTGSTGSGKSTTLAAMIDLINSTSAKHIVTIEDPIEFVHEGKMSLIDQREISSDTPSFTRALRSVFRQDPDVVLIGEMRDLETIGTALTLAETGHLTLATLHTNSCAQTIHRIIDSFPASQQDQVRSQLSLVLEAVITQSLMPMIQGGRILACEVMIATPAIRNLIRDGRVHQIYASIQAGQTFGMRTMNQSLAELVSKKQVAKETALARSPMPEEMLTLIRD